MFTKQIQQFENALNKLKEVINKENNSLFKNEHEIIRDSIIQRFEFTFETAWKLLKNILNDKGLTCYSPKDCIKEALKINFINNEEKWLVILQARNLTSHVYNEQTAETIYKEIKKFLSLFDDLLKQIKSEIKY